VARVIFSAGLIFLILKNNYYIKKKKLDNQVKI